MNLLMTLVFQARFLLLRISEPGFCVNDDPGAIVFLKTSLPGIDHSMPIDRKLGRLIPCQQPTRHCRIRI